MKFEYTGRHVDVTPAIRAHVEEHFDKIDTVFDDSTTRAHVRIEVEKNRHIGEIVVHWKEHTLTARDVNNDMYLALSRAIEKIEKQALKLKKKIIDRSHSGSRTQSLETTAAADGSAAIEHRPPKSHDPIKLKNPAPEISNGDGRAPRIISARRYTVKPMTAEEAAMRLTGEADQFIVFRDADTDRVGVLYKRNDGNFGLIEP